MRLLDTQTLQLSEVFEDSVPEYAILSHTWDRDEVTYRHIQSLDVARGMQGFAKVEGACRLAAREGFKYIWIDTCCIDKSSSAELSEAINSMYSWYQKSAKCYAYLADVDHLDFPDATTQFEKSRWFERGWTLQELIAPSQVVFLSHDWTRLGTKSELCGLISQITGIDIGTLSGADLRFVCVARKMFWASRRQTTRVEDMAYCLLGLFSVNMPLIYGEGTNSFIRLQEEIIKLYDDQSIFAWTIPDEEHSPRKFYGLLAESPAAFKETGNNIIPFPSRQSGRQPTRVMSAGLETELLLQPPAYFFGLLRRSRLGDSVYVPLLIPSPYDLFLALSSFASLMTSPSEWVQTMMPLSLAALSSALFSLPPLLTVALVHLVIFSYVLFSLPQLWSLSNKRLIKLPTMSVSVAYTRRRRRQHRRNVALKLNNMGSLINHRTCWSDIAEDNHFRAVLDCQFIRSWAGTSDRPCLDIVALDPRNSTSHSSFARINVRRLYKADLSRSIVSLTFKRGISCILSGACTFSGFGGTREEQLYLGTMPWEFRKVSVPHNPKEILPLGFLFHCVNNKNTKIDIIDASPTQQWFNHDNILQRSLLTMNSTVFNNAVSQNTEEVTTVTDGVVRLKIHGSPFSPESEKYGALHKGWQWNENCCLVIGMHYMYQPSNRDWVQVPWCRFINTNPEDTLDRFMNVTGEEDTSRIWMGTDLRLDAKIEGMNNHDLYDVVLSLR